MSKNDGGSGAAMPLSAEKQQTDNFEYLVFDDQELANSYADNEASVKVKHQNVSPCNLTCVALHIPVQS